VHADAGLARKLGRRYAELDPIVTVARELAAAREDLTAARQLAAEDPGFAAEAEQLAQRVPELETRLSRLLVPRDPHDADGLVMEVKSVRAARSRRCSPPTSCACTCATPSAAAGAECSDSVPSTWAGSRTSR
jgi:hypothetical protein